MKKFFIAIAAIATAAACSQNETISLDNGEAISFGNAFVENSVRAADPSYSANDIKSFKVYGTVDGGQGAVVIYPGTVITKDGAEYNKAWTCPVQQYWIEGAQYKFVGIVDGKKSGVTETNTVDGMPTTISYTADGATDLLCQTIDRKDDTSLVAFSFNHLLAKVNFTVKNNSKDADKYSFVVKNIAFEGNTAGVYDVAKAAWDADKFTTGSTAVGNTRTVGETEVKDIVVATTAASNELGTEVLFLPGTYGVSFIVDILYDGKLITTTKYPATGTYEHSLEAGKAYNFIVEVAVGQTIQFSVEKQPTWATPTNNVPLQ